MNGKDVMGILFANTGDELLSELTEKRSMASVPFGARYRLIDFALSNFVNAGVTTVGVITKANYQSLMDHIGSAKSWDLDRKKGGLHILPPYSNSANGVYKGQIDALLGVKDFLKRNLQDYVVLAHSSVALNIDISEMLEYHIKNGADITVAYKHGKFPENSMKAMLLSVDNGKVTSVRFPVNERPECDYSLGITVIKKSLLIELLENASAENKTDLSRDIIMPMVDKLGVYGYEFNGFAAVMDSAESYVSASMSLLDNDVRQDLFNPSRPVYTKIKDAMPTRYGINASVNNSLIGDGCIIEGTVKNSILFRGVKVGKGAHIENCIIMQDSLVADNAELKYVVADKSSKIGYNRELCGAPSYYIFIKKEAEV